MDKPRQLAAYGDYLQLDKILGAQKLLSVESGQPVHEELFFIIVHQVYELWFKQIIADLDSVIEIFKASPEKQDLELVLIRLRRINKIFHLLLQEFEVLETMSPLEFLNFRGALGTMSGFQSYQFRLIEVKFGIRRDERMLYGKCPFEKDLKKEHKEIIYQAEGQDSLFGCIDKWLSDRPYIEKKGYKFKDSYSAAVEKMLREEKKRLEAKTDIVDEERHALERRLEELRTNFDNIFDQQHYQEAIEKGERRLSYRALLTALYIRLYRRQPPLQLPDLLLSAIVELNATFTLWRYRHSQMVQKMIGWKSGTGGTSGVQYLQSTVEKYDIFSDLYLIPMLLIPEAYLPTPSVDVL